VLWEERINNGEEWSEAGYQPAYFECLQDGDLIYNARKRMRKGEFKILNTAIIEINKREMIERTKGG